MDIYRPVSNDFKEELEVLAALKKNCQVKFRSDNDAIATLTTQVISVYNSEGIDYLKTSSGLQIRLDKILEVNGKRPENFA